jgi:MFS transporter, UMF1 family
VVMSAFAVFAVGFTPGEALNILLILTVVAVLASFGWGWLNDRIGPKRTLIFVLGTWAAGLLILALVLEPIPFLVAGAVLGAGLGGVGVTDRLLLLRLAPPERTGEMLGIYGLVGKLSAVIGPVLYTSIVAGLLPSLDRGAYQVAIASLLGLLALGFVLILGVPEGRAGSDDAVLPASEPAIVPPGEAAR